MYKTGCGDLKAHFTGRFYKCLIDKFYEELFETKYRLEAKIFS